MDILSENTFMLMLPFNVSVELQWLPCQSKSPILPAPSASSFISCIGKLLLQAEVVSEL